MKEIAGLPNTFTLHTKIKSYVIPQYPTTRIEKDGFPYFNFHYCEFLLLIIKIDKYVKLKKERQCKIK